MAPIWTPSIFKPKKERMRYERNRGHGPIPVWFDIALRGEEISAMQYINDHAPQHIKDVLLEASRKPYLFAMDGPFFRDMKAPFMIADETAVTLAATSKMLHSAAWIGLPASYFPFAGKLIKLTYMARATTGATPGNFTFESRFATTDAGGTLLATGAAIAAGASKTNITVNTELYCRCRALGATGALISWGWVIPEPSSVILPSTSNPYSIPTTAPAQTTTDTTAAGGLSLQLKRSGSTAETFQVHDLQFEALN
ncbi:MAG TPA: hypothetical protein VF077_07165 [Nitrospiraceae bacterium]